MNHELKSISIKDNGKKSFLVRNYEINYSVNNNLKKIAVKRLNDFVQFDRFLRSNYPSEIIMLLPKKDDFKKVGMDIETKKNYLEKRLRMLENYMNDLISESRETIFLPEIQIFLDNNVAI